MWVIQYLAIDISKSGLGVYLQADYHDNKYTDCDTDNAKCETCFEYKLSFVKLCQINDNKYKIHVHSHVKASHMWDKNSQQQKVIYILNE